MHKRIVIFLAAAFFVAGAGVADAQTKGNWIKDQNGCKHWDTDPGPNRTVTWTGGCKNGKAHGQGELKWFTSGKLTEHAKTAPLLLGKEGSGPYEADSYDKKGNVDGSFVGQMKNGELYGQVTFIWENGNNYVGQLKNSEFNGKGTYTWADGTKYVGQFRNGKSHGQGTLTSADGRYFKGEYRNGKRWNGVEVHKDGDRYPIRNGRWSSGTLKGQLAN